MAHPFLPVAYSGSTSTAGQGMAHAHRSATLPHPGTHLSARDIYSSATPGFPRRPDHHHLQRSPPYSGIRRHNPFTPTSTPTAYGPLKMDAAGFSSTSSASRTQNSIPPLMSMTKLGYLSYADSSNTPIKIDISGIIDKGFFIADNEWTCYRRNYFSCVCSFSLSPLLHGVDIQFQPTGSAQTYIVKDFAMCISAVVSDNDNHTIELVQHTPKRDKGPVAPPDKIRLSPKPPQSSHHPLTSLYAAADGSLGSSRYGDQTSDNPFGQPRAQGSSWPTEHTFERIQFKQATANNGKRRAAQQYYHLIVELWADVGQQPQQQPGGAVGSGATEWIKVAYRKSAKMIVRGRSPGHYQSERRGSSSSGPGAAGGGSTGGGGGGYQLAIPGPPDYTMGGYGQPYDPRSNPYGATGRTHHDLNMEPLVSADEVKAMNESKGYQYYAATLYEADNDPRHQTHQSSSHHHHNGHHHQLHQHHQHQQQQHQAQSSQQQQPVELFSHARQEVSEASSSSSGSSTAVSTTFDPTRVKSELDQTTAAAAAAAAVAASQLPSLVYQSGPYYSQRCGRFEGKPTSAGQYPTGAAAAAAATAPSLMAHSSSGTTMSMT
jgi:meiosis-specific transcription factor NDT80